MKRSILYLHGFASSGASGTVEILRKAFLGNNEAERVTVIAPDIPVDPVEALPLIKGIAAKEQHPGMSRIFHGGHRMNADVVHHVLIPFIHELQVFEGQK